MQAISINQPFASLIVKGHKKFETRGRLPYPIIGQRIGICSSGTRIKQWKEYCKREEFQKFYRQLGWPDISKLPHGFLVGTVIIESRELMTPELITTIKDEEKAYGEWKPGNYAWALRDPEYFTEFQPVLGRLGFYDLDEAIANAKKKGKTTG